MKRKAFVTGAPGFLGNNLLEELICNNWDITVYAHPSSDRTFFQNKEITCLLGNILDEKHVEKSIPPDTEALFHMAGNTSMWSKNKKKQYEDNVVGTKNIVNGCLKKQVKKLIYTSSISAYGYHGKKINEKTDSNALTCRMNYNITKYLSEQEIKKALDRGLNSTILNPCNIIGPHDIKGWAQMIENVHNETLPGIPPGSAMFCHAKDVARAHVAAVDKGRSGENYLLGGVHVSFLEVFNTIQDLLNRPITTKVQKKYLLKVVTGICSLQSFFTGKEPLLTPATYNRVVGHVFCDDSKAIKELGYERSTLKEMLNDSYTWLKVNNRI